MMSIASRRSVVLRAIIGIAVTMACAASAIAADMSKTIRTAFIVAETGFDPAATSDI
jgi:hypothetical protein